MSRARASPRLSPHFSRCARCLARTFAARDVLRCVCFLPPFGGEVIAVDFAFAVSLAYSVSLPLLASPMLRAVSRTAVRSLPPRLPSISRCRIGPFPARPFSSHHHGPRGAHTPHHKPSHTPGTHSTPPTTPSPVSTPLSSPPSSLPPPNPGAPPFTTPPLQPGAPPSPPAGPTPPPTSAGGGEQHHMPPHKRIARRIIPALVAAAKLMFRKVCSVDGAAG